MKINTNLPGMWYKNTYAKIITFNKLKKKSSYIIVKLQTVKDKADKVSASEKKLRQKKCSFSRVFIIGRTNRLWCFQLCLLLYSPNISLSLDLLSLFLIQEVPDLWPHLRLTIMVVRYDSCKLGHLCDWSDFVTLFEAVVKWTIGLQRAGFVKNGKSVPVFWQKHHKNAVTWLQYAVNGVTWVGVVAMGTLKLGTLKRSMIILNSHKAAWREDSL